MAETQTPQTKVEPVVVKEVAPVVQTKVVPTTQQANEPSELKHAKAFLAEYAGVMDPINSLTVDSMAEQQFRLWMNLTNTIENTAPDKFRLVWTAVLKFIDENKSQKGVFNERFAMRAVNHWRGTVEAQNRFSRLMDLLRQTSNPATRSSIAKQISFVETLKGFSDQAIGRVADFYAV